MRGYLILCLGIMCLIGCQGSYVRDTNVITADNTDASTKEAGKIEVTREEIKIKRPEVKGTDKTNTNTIETVRNEGNKQDTYSRETVGKEDDLSPNNILEELPVKEVDKRKDNKTTALYDETGIVSFISDEYDGRMTASGVRYDRNKMTAAHPSLQFDTKVLVTNLRNKRSVEVIIIDRFTPTKDRILNVSHSAAMALDLVESGITKVGIKIISNPD